MPEPMSPDVREKLTALVEAAQRVDRYFDGKTMQVAATVEVLNGLSDAVEALTPAVLAALRAAPPAAPESEEDGKCYWCGENTESLAGNPMKWPLRFPANDSTGIVRWHHTGCVMDRLYGNAAEDEKSV